MEGDAAHTAVHDGVAYYFASAANQEAFERNPTLYVPQNGGFCTFGVSVGKKFDGDPQYAAVVDDKLYVFLNESIYQEFQKDRRGTIRKAAANWKKHPHHPGHGTLTYWRLPEGSRPQPTSRSNFTWKTAYLYLALSGVLTLLLWIPYILARVFVWGLPTFLSNYPDGYPATQPEPPLWAQRAQRAHLNMVETMPAFIAVVLAAGQLVDGAGTAVVAQWAQVFFLARLGYAAVYLFGIPYLRTPVYLTSWFAVLMIGAQML